MSSLQEVHRGRVWKFGDSVDTNQLAGGGLVGASAAETLKINCLRGLRPEFPDAVRPGDFVVGGENFGCGSSRQTAVEALQLCGVAVVLADTMARIFRRNSIALGLPAFGVPKISDLVDDGDELIVDYPNRVVRNASSGATLPLATLPPSVEEVYESGGLVQVIGKRLAERGIFPTSARPATAPKGALK
ncbi:3-isopropylmalate dehydratase [Amycolatopsis rhabdoformis]|uniref:3-isopropylmalate dehydratase small subunit n=1 Tax=Amycolatopsis rhabdoformis TaxID=1448059 RepID=A0ABZ1IDS7_9PSEU|nr:3-isopropylmalate dehydratase [Amycolatopsis rhabdoformis]WSE31901.1 3-isopropylmalate dehydratase [Amycolatopsis rhabdoformis]